MQIREMEVSDFEAVIRVGNLVHGDGYLNSDELGQLYEKGIKSHINASFVAIENDELLGFRLTYAAGNWAIDKWCSTEYWGVDPQKVCYFKSNTLIDCARGKGLGGLLLSKSVEAVKQQGAIAGLAHLWQQSPNNSAVRYFSKAGGKLIKAHPNRWSWENMSRHYFCSVCGGNCRCTACEMLLMF
ncbi:MAG: GNAT family N-acetyltransferase [Parashewanella sp.]